MPEEKSALIQTKKWIQDVVIGNNFCPFAAKEFKQQSIHYEISSSDKITSSLSLFLKECIRLDQDKSIETTLILFPNHFSYGKIICYSLKELNNY